jgi:betaine-aldehyde dehydrogenase
MQVWDRLFIGGEWVAPTTDDRIVVTSPATEEPIGEVPHAGPADIDRAVAAAHRAFHEGPWRWLPAEQRAAAVRAVTGKLWARLDELADTVTSEVGITRSFAGGAQVPGAIAMAEAFADRATDLDARAELTGMALPAELVREPVGVVAAISPWNAPLYLALLKVTPALLAGCTVVLKLPEEAPLNGHILAECLAGADLPPGVVNVLAAGRDGGRRLVADERVDLVSFTGSTATGSEIMATCAGRIARLVLELGGKSAGIVLDDADLDATVAGLVPGALINNGEACAALTRVLVPRARHDEIVDALCAAVGALEVGDPFDERTFLGPMITARHRERVEGYIRAGLDEGAGLACGGGRPPRERGWYVEPTVLVGVDNAMRVAREEIFGPVLSVIPYDSDDDAVRIANDTPFGLAGSVFTGDRERGRDVLRRLRAGTVTLNGFGLDPMIPYGGYKRSGLGREGGLAGIEEYRETKAVFDLGPPSH